MKFLSSIIVLTLCGQMLGCAQPVELPYNNDFESLRLPDHNLHDATAITSKWGLEGGELVQSVDVGSLPQQNAFEGSTHVGSQLIFTSRTPIKAFQLSTDLNIQSSTGDECGVVFWHQDDSNYYRLSTSPRDGFTMLQRKQEGVWNTLAKNARGAPIGEPQRFSITATDGFIEVSQNNTLLFALNHKTTQSGSVGFYARNRCAFDNLVISDMSTEPRIVVTEPHNFSVGNKLHTTVKGVVRHAPPEHRVDVRANGVLCDTTHQPLEAGLFAAVCTTDENSPVSLVAQLLDANQKIISQQSISLVAPTGLNIVTMGDSNTNGRGDNYARDGIAQSGLRHSSRGYQANLMDLMMSAAQPLYSVIYNTGIVGEQSGWMLESRIDGLLEQHGDADKALLMIGTNDVLNRQPSGLGCANEACKHTYAANLQAIVSKILTRDIQLHLALLPPLFGDHSNGRYADPATHESNALVREYNKVAKTQVKGYELGPDLFEYFLGESNRSFLFADLYHPNGLGTAIVASLWYRSLYDADAPLPFIVDDLLIRTVEDSQGPSPIHNYQLNLLETGDTFYVDEQWVLTSIPTELEDARWLMTANQDRIVSTSDYLSFDTGETTTTLYLTVPVNKDDATPKWLTSWEETDLDLQASMPNSTRLRTFKQTNVQGKVVLPGPSYKMTKAASFNYVVAILPI